MCNLKSKNTSAVVSILTLGIFLSACSDAGIDPQSNLEPEIAAAEALQQPSPISTLGQTPASVPAEPTNSSEPFPAFENSTPRPQTIPIPVSAPEPAPAPAPAPAPVPEPAPEPAPEPEEPEAE